MAPRGSASPQTELSAYSIPNMVQGVSQQTAQQRRDSQCEAQFDCVNSPLNGCEARPGFDYLGKITGPDLATAYCYEIFRGDAEHYLVVINSAAYGAGTPRKLHVYDLTTGNEATVTFTADESYLVPTEAPNLAYMAATTNDTTFIGQRNIKAAMDGSNLAPAAINQAILYWKAAGYIITFQVSVTYNGHVYTFSYTTAGNGSQADAGLITTNYIAAAFYRALSGSAAVPTPTGTAVGSLPAGVIPGVGPHDAGDTGNTGHGAGSIVTGSTSLVSLGFTVSLNGNCILIGRPDNAPFTVDTADGVGDTFLIAIKDTCQSFDQLPKTCFPGFTTKVSGTNLLTQDDYYVQFSGSGSTGVWQEVVAPGTPLTLDATTMPHILVNTGVNTFEWKVAPWGIRVSGDGINSAKDPSFVGQYIRELAYDHARLVVMWEGSAVWSRARNVFVFFPDTAQTVLDTDPIDAQPGGGKTIALLRKVVQVAESIYLWAEKIQFRVTAGINKFTQDSIEVPVSTNYEFSAAATPRAVGQSLYFVTEPGPFASVRDLSFSAEGKALGAVDVTAHVKRYVPTGVRWMTASDTLGALFATTTGDPSGLYCYNYLLGDANSRVQSAWNHWRLPASSSVLWASVSLNYLFALVRRSSTETLLLKMDLSADRVDTDTGATYLTRLDFRVTDAQCTLSYNATTLLTTITLPYTPSEADGYDGTTPATCPMFVASRVSTSKGLRGKNWPIASITASSKQIVVRGDCHAESLYIGYRITASRQESRFYIKTQKGIVPTDRLQVKNYKVNYGDGTGFFRADVTYKEGQPSQSYTMTGRIFGDPSNILGTYALPEGTLLVPIDCDSGKYTINLVNDTYLPSRWVSSSYDYQASFRAKPSAYGQ